ncbi:hypothetical protein SAMN02745673_04057, partial [Marinactinospora thermotolerans DSM 45154]
LHTLVGKADEHHEALSGEVARSTGLLTTQAEENHAETAAAIADANSAVVKLSGTTETQLADLRTHLRKQQNELQERLDAQHAELRERDDAQYEGLAAKLAEAAANLRAAAEGDHNAAIAAIAEVGAALAETNLAIAAVEERDEARSAELRSAFDERVESLTAQGREQHGALLELIAEHRDSVGARLEQQREELSGKVDQHLASVTAKIDGRYEALTAKFEHGLGRLSDRFDTFEGHFDGSFEGVEGRLDGLNGRLDGLDGRVTGVEGKFEGVHGQFDGVDGRLEAIDDRLEALNQRLGQLPASLEVSEVHRRLSELVERPIIDHSERFDAIDQRLGESLDPLLNEIRTRPDRHEFEETISDAVETSHDDITKRLAALEETMLALAEALLRPGRDGKRKRRPVDDDED